MIVFVYTTHGHPQYIQALPVSYRNDVALLNEQADWILLSPNCSNDFVLAAPNGVSE